ncbi:MAG: Hachiman antiphage defense system protein HamA [Planctomycetota bacterium]
MRDLGLEVETVTRWFAEEQRSPFVLVRVPDEHAAAWSDVLGVSVRRCYIDDTVLKARVQATGCPRSEIVAARLPDPGSTMSGDFGEILVFLYHAAAERDVDLIGPKKWRLKQDRTKPAPHSDVVHFVLPSWPRSSTEDRILCSEVKTKATAGASSPISKAIDDCEKDRTSRLAKTLVWLRERALHEDLGSTTIDHLDRFIKATDHPQAKKCFHAVAVICENLVDNELADAPDEAPADHTVVVIAVPNLKERYEAVFDAAHATVAEAGGET